MNSKSLPSKGKIVITMLLTILMSCTSFLGTGVTPTKAKNNVAPPTAKCITLIPKLVEACLNVRIKDNWVEMGAKITGLDWQWKKIAKATYNGSIPDFCAHLNPSKYLADAQLCLRSYKQTVGLNTLTATGVLKVKFCVGWGVAKNCYTSPGWSFKI